MRDNFEKQELHCHNCGKYVRFDLDLSIDGDYKLECPNCGHLHFRVVKDGIIKDTRWGQDPAQAQYQSVAKFYTTLSSTSVSSNSYQMTYSGSSTTSSSFLADSWASGNYSNT